MSPALRARVYALFDQRVELENALADGHARLIRANPQLAMELLSESRGHHTDWPDVETITDDQGRTRRVLSDARGKAFAVVLEHDITVLRDIVRRGRAALETS